MSYHDTFKSDSYTDGRTKQAFKDETDINKLLAKANRGESISHLAKYGATYGDFTDMDDLLDAHNKLARGQQIFQDLPGEIKREFNQDPRQFYKFVNDPDNANRLGEVLPDLAQRGTQLPAVKRTPDNQREPTPAPEAPEGDTEPRP